jgi:uncharacterized repeat protein (TIGR01451 family)
MISSKRAGAAITSGLLTITRMTPGLARVAPRAGGRIKARFESKNRLLGFLLALALVVSAFPIGVFGGASLVRAASTPLLTESFTSTTAMGWTTSGSTCLTAAVISATNSIPACPAGDPGGVSGTLPDTDGQGALRLTNDVGNLSSFAYSQQAYPSGQGYTIDFDSAAYDTTSAGPNATGADGISFFLIDGAITPTMAGAYGGSLGYAQKSGSPNTPGLVGGYLGVGLDEYGNFANDNEGRGAGCAAANQSPNSGVITQSVTVRGAAGSDNNHYCYIANSGSLTPGISVPAATTRTAALRHVHITLTPSNNISVAMDFHDGRGLITVIPPLNIAAVSGQPPLPSTFKFGFASSTGGANNIHELRDLVVTPDYPDLAVTSTHMDPFTAGTDASYTISATDAITAGPTTGPVVITDTVPNGLTPTGASGTDWSCPINGQIVTCTYTGVAPISTNAPPAPITLNVHVAPNAPASVTNSVTIATDNDTNLSNNTATDPTTITSSADLAVTNAASPNPVVAGQDVTYTAVVTNTGPSDAGAYTFQERVPANTTFQRVIGPSCSAPDNTGLVSCNAPSLAAGATQTYQFVAAVDPAATNGVTITATAHLANLATLDPNPGNNSASATATVATSADLFVTSVNAAPSPATAGQNVTYATTFGSNGPSVATNAVLTMTVPAGASFVSANGGIFSCPSHADGQGRVVCTAANVPVASNDVAQLTVSIPASATTPLDSQSTLTSGTSDPDPTNNSASGSAGVQTAADLSVGVVVSPQPVVAGQDITYTTTLSNAGPSDATAPVVTTTIPTSTTFVSLASPNGWNCTAPSPGPGGTVSCTPNGGGSLAANHSATFALVVLADQGVLTGTGLLATSTTSSQTTDPIAANNTDSANPNATTSSDLGVTSSLAPSPAVAGQPLIDTVTVTNTGPSAAAAPVVTMTIPASTTFQSLTSPGDWTCTTPNVGGTGTVLCTPNSGRLAAGASAQFVLTLGVPASVPNNSSIGVTTTTGSQTNDPNQTNNASTATVTVATVADLTVSDAASSPVVAGQDVTYTTTLVNNGPSDAPNPVVTATVPAGTTFGSFTASGWTCSVPNASGVVTCTAVTLPAGHTVSFPLVVRVNANVPASVTLTSDTGASDAFDPDMSNNTASADAQVGSVADLAVTLAAAPSPVVAGQTVTYTAALTNTGPSDAASAVFIATIPASTTVQSVTAPANWTCVTPAPGSGGVVSCQPNGGSLAAGAHATIAFQLAVSPSALSATLSSVATVSSASGDPTPANNSATARAAVTTLADLAMSETASPDPVIAGQDATYTAALTNTGPSDAASPVVTLTVPTNTTFVSLAAPTGWTCGAPDAGGVMTCTDPTLAAGQRVSFPLVVHVSPSVTDGATLTSATGASTTTTDPNLSNNTARAGARVTTRADLQVTNVVVPTPILPGQTVTYRAAFTNAGPSDAREVIFTETLPAGTTFVAVTAPDGWTCALLTANGTTTVSCTASTLDVGATGTIALSVRIDPNATGGTVLTAASTIASATVDPDASNNSSTARVTVLQTPPTATAATSTPVPTGTATNTATAAPANTATSTAAPSATSSPTTPADTATTPSVPPTHTPLSTTDVSLAPSSTTRYVGIPDTLTVSVTRDGAPALSLPVTCRVVSGPDAGLVMPVMTDAHGHASCSFTSRKVGTDTVVASVTDVTVAHASNLVRVQWTPAGPPCSVQADLLTGPVLTHAPAYHGRLIDGALGRGRCAAVAALAAPRSAGQARTQARSAAPSPSACTQGWAAVSSYDYTITGPTGAVMRTPRLAGHVLPGDTIQASFTIKPRPARCATVRVSLASYAAPSLANNARALSQQALYQSATRLFGAGAHNLALRVDVPARPLAVPSSVRPRIAGVRVRGTRVFHHRARRSVHARSSRPTKGHRRGA